jgi:hypothetical protein
MPALSSSPRTLDRKARERIRERSKDVFGNKDRLDVAVAIARSADDAVNATDLAAETGLVNSRVRAQLLALTRADLLSEVPQTGEDLKRWYLRQESPFWQTCLDLYAKWTQ